MWLNILINIGLYAFKEYAKNTDSKQDDKILEVVQIGSMYLYPKVNNSVTQTMATQLSTAQMRKTQRSK